MDDGFRGDPEAISPTLRHRLLTCASDPRHTMARLRSLERVAHLDPWYDRLLNAKALDVTRSELLHLLMSHIPYRWGVGVIDAIVTELEGDGGPGE